MAAFFMPEGQEGALAALGVKDSKRTSDGRCLEIAATLKRGYPYHSVITVGPEKYNELWAKLRNLNRLLAWGHARAIENVLERVPAGKAVTDQFGDEKFVRNALLQKGREIELVQMPRAEEDPAVAAASILARAEFLTRLRYLSKDVGMELPKGASDLVEAAAVEARAREGPGHPRTGWPRPTSRRPSGSWPPPGWTGSSEMIVLVKVGLVLALLLVLIRLKWDLGLVLFLDACLAAVLFGMKPARVRPGRLRRRGLVARRSSSPRSSSSSSTSASSCSRAAPSGPWSTRSRTSSGTIGSSWPSPRRSSACCR
ncbi:MAG: ribonuclease HIII [Candidatus Moduliflexus flocculans]|nr:ribonuclease HIII [Candidatus Moduliflexus flocculans]